MSDINRTKDTTNIVSGQTTKPVLSEDDQMIQDLSLIHI